ncbi:hypothetical protein FIE12Z_1519 [Fusarium flagelliforme]|uniref:Uncharacterized protein n=1 Tax=Fusarium flagelliforme TaxID=2675880 RepID=A0A395N2N6_9HYPO|nr:hypothetical protein FIE12Z_1519 [Fusarium flagelliforme]
MMFINLRFLENFSFEDYRFERFLILSDWQAWETAWLFRLPAILANPDVPIVLLTSGCNVGNEINCERACKFSEHMFNSSETLWNCLTIATVAKMTEGKNPEYRLNKTEKDSLMDTFKPGPLGNFSDMAVFARYIHCALQSCSDSKYEGCPTELWEGRFQNIPFNLTSVRDLGGMMGEEYCAKADPGVDYDIAGPGDWVKTSRFGMAAGFKLVDLQEAQAVFLALYSVATIATFSGSPSTGLSNITSLPSWITNYLVLRGMVTADMYPLLFVQLILHKTRARDWYTLFLVVDTASLANHLKTSNNFLRCGGNAGPKAYYQTFNTGNAKITGQYSDNDPFPQGNQGQSPFDSNTTNTNSRPQGDNPWYLDRDAKSFFIISSNAQAPIHTIMTFLILDWIMSMVKSQYSRPDTWLHRRLKSLRQRLPSPLERTFGERYFWLLSEALWISMEVLAVVMGIIGVKEFWTFLDVLRSGTEGRDSSVHISNWSFGQLVAACVWFPVILKFLSLVVDGVLPGLRKRVGELIEVTYRKEDDKRDSDVAMETLIPGGSVERSRTDEMEGNTLTERRSWGRQDSWDELCEEHHQ